MKTNYFLLLFALIVLGCSKDDDDGPSPCNDQFNDESFRFFEFEHDGTGTTFYAWTSDTAVISDVEAQLALPKAQRSMHINGAIDRIPQGCMLNKEWNWFFVPDQWVMAEVSIELCDGNPNFVEENIDEYIRIGGYCPWGSYVLREIDNPF